MSVLRMAGQRLMDNRLTRSWANTMDRNVVSPIERALISEEQLKSVIPVKISRMSSEEDGFTDDQLKLMQALSGNKWTEEARDRSGARMDILSGEQPRRDWALATANELADMGELDRNRLMGIVGQLPADAGSLTNVGELARMAVGHPAAAYGAVLGGGALAVKGALDVIARMQAGQPVADEEVAAADAVLKQASAGVATY